MKINVSNEGGVAKVQVTHGENQLTDVISVEEGHTVEVRLGIDAAAPAPAIEIARPDEAAATGEQPAQDQPAPASQTGQAGQAVDPAQAGQDPGYPPAEPGAAPAPTPPTPPSGVPADQAANPAEGEKAPTPPPAE